MTPWLLLLACTGEFVLDETESDTQSPTDTEETQDTEVGETVTEQRPVIYQLVVRHFGNTNDTRETDGTLEVNGVGKFSDVDDTALEGLVELGVTHVWLTGVLRQATTTEYDGLPADDPDIVKGRAGSFYAVRDYYDVCPDYADDPEERLAEFQELVDRIHSHDLDVLIDLVPNHVARSYESVVYPERSFGASDDTSVFFDADNSFFYLVDPPGQALTLERPDDWSPEGLDFDGAFAPEDGSTQDQTPKATGNNVTSPSPSANDWYETIKLNYGYNFATGESSYTPTPKTWEDVDHILAYWQDLGVDGFRADFAHYVPQDAWSYLIWEARQRDEDVFFMAEAYENLDGLLDAGFDAVYHDAAYDTLKGLYLGWDGQSDVDSLMASLGDEERPKYVHYLENHDERRIASALETSASSADDSGFGSAAAGRQLAPILYLYAAGPVLFYNGQEVGEAAEGVEGFGGDDGRSTIFDYWSLPALQGWVNNHAYDGGGLDADQASLRAWYADLLALVQDESARGTGYWGLEYYNTSSTFSDFPDELYTFARYGLDSGRLMVVTANFAVGASTSGEVRLPSELLDAAGFDDRDTVTVTRVLDVDGAADETVGTFSLTELVSDGFPVSVADQASNVYILD